MEEQESNGLKVQLGLDQLMFLAEVTKKLNDMGVQKSSGLTLRVSVQEEATQELVGVWDNSIDGADWQLILR